ncbi:MAG TPA: superoxide dismutase family protein [Longimicrobiales bacterium]|nr:superoxide dismutase family protein [Longimicrobiales bacterium]
MRRLGVHFTVAAALALAACSTAPSLPVPPGAARASFVDTAGKPLGMAVLVPQSEGVMVRMDLAHLPPGTHGFHIHTTGRCDPPQFQTAGGHFNPTGKQHGSMNPQGKHLGDLPNLDVPANGRVKLAVLAPGVTLEGGEAALLDADGSALVIHASADDYKTDPSGNSGARIACAVVRK